MPTHIANQRSPFRMVRAAVDVETPIHLAHVLCDGLDIDLGRERCVKVPYVDEAVV